MSSASPVYRTSPPSVTVELAAEEPNGAPRGGSPTADQFVAGYAAMVAPTANRFSVSSNVNAAIALAYTFVAAAMSADAGAL